MSSSCYDKFVKEINDAVAQKKSKRELREIAIEWCPKLAKEGSLCRMTRKNEAKFGKERHDSDFFNTHMVYGIGSPIQAGISIRKGQNGKDDELHGFPINAPIFGTGVYWSHLYGLFSPWMRAFKDKKRHMRAKRRKTSHGIGSKDGGQQRRDPLQMLDDIGFSVEKEHGDTETLVFSTGFEDDNTSTSKPIGINLNVVPNTALGSRPWTLSLMTATATPIDLTIAFVNKVGTPINQIGTFYVERRIQPRAPTTPMVTRQRRLLPPQARVVRIPLDDPYKLLVGKRWQIPGGKWRQYGYGLRPTDRIVASLQKARRPDRIRVISHFNLRAAAVNVEYETIKKAYSKDLFMRILNAHARNKVHGPAKMFDRTFGRTELAILLQRIDREPDLSAHILDDAPQWIYDDKRIMLALVRMNGDLLQMASPRLRNDPQFGRDVPNLVLEAIKASLDGHPIVYASRRLKESPNFIREAQQITQNVVQILQLEKKRKE
ncbi:MAG: DUF4116 domain-containing protein, partial [Promethearchaeota archaeon]